MDEEKRIYKSFHEIPVRDYMYFPKGSIDTVRPGKFSRLEVKHLLISIIVLTFAFSLTLSGNNIIEGLTRGFNLDDLAFGLVLSFLGIVTAFFFHEFSHKLVAQKYGLWAEYRMFPKGLYLALLLGLLTPFIFAAPGAVMFRGGARDYETGQIALAGPAANVIVAYVMYILYNYFFFESFIGQVLGFICFINAFLATFNLLPFGPLDGTKIIRWNPTVWILLLISSIFILGLIFTTVTFVL
jgi:Zn-dependent protease